MAIGNKKFTITCNKCGLSVEASDLNVHSRYDVNFDNIPYITCLNTLTCDNEVEIFPTPKTEKQITLDPMNRRAYDDVLGGVGPTYKSNEYYMRCYEFWVNIYLRSENDNI